MCNWRIGQCLYVVPVRIFTKTNLACLASSWQYRKITQFSCRNWTSTTPARGRKAADRTCRPKIIVCLFLPWNMWKLQFSSCAHADLEGQNHEIFHPSTLREPLIGESCGKASPLTERVGEGFAPVKTYRCTCHLSFNPASKGCLRFDYPKETTTWNLETNSKQCWEHLVSTVTMVFSYIYIIQVCLYHVYIYILYKYAYIMCMYIYIHIIQTRVGTLSSRILFHTRVKVYQSSQLLMPSTCHPLRPWSRLETPKPIQVCSKELKLLCLGPWKRTKMGSTKQGRLRAAMVIEWWIIMNVQIDSAMLHWRCGLTIDICNRYMHTKNK